MNKPKILIACEFSGVVRDAFRDRGHDAMSCDLLPTEAQGPHYQGDVYDILNNRWDLMIAHPPCQYLCNSGVRWLYNKDKTKNTERWWNLDIAARFFKILLTTPHIPMVCVENPIPHGHAGLPPYTQTIQPYEFGHGETKRTCLWLRGLPKLTPTNIVEGREPKVHFAAPGPDRWRRRSITPQGFADAMADQWGPLL